MKYHKIYDNTTILEIFDKTTMKKWKNMAAKMPKLFGPVHEYFGNGGDSAQALGVLAELRVMLSTIFCSSFAVKNASFCTADCLKSGGKKIMTTITQPQN